MLVNADFHIHSKYSGGTSKNMELEVIAKQAELKGLHIVGTGDALHPKWLREIKRLEESNGIYFCNGVGFAVTLEVEDNRKVHHTILLPDTGAAEELREKFSRYGELGRDGRPHLHIGSEEIVDAVVDAGGLIGPSHAFVPWTSIYKEYDSLSQCYGSAVSKVKFLELGLSADTYMADTIAELQELTFMSNSDAHSPWPNKLGREFNRLEIKELSYEEIAMAVERRKGRRFVLNVGFDPRLGKYHRTACIKCFKIYELEEAISLNWRCRKCGGRIKKGVRDRIKEIATWDEPRHPEHRPPYIRIAPLSEIISRALGMSSYSKKVQESWRALVKAFGSEIAVLIDVPEEDIAQISTPEIASYIKSFREGKFKIKEGGGGKYGEIVFDQVGQKSLDVF